VPCVERAGAAESHPMPGPLEILCDDEDLIVVHKPSGLSVHRGLGAERDTVLTALRAQGLGALHPVHRLDRATSGVLVLGRSPDAARALGRAFAQGAVAKAYVALVRGTPPERTEVDYAIPCDEGGHKVDARTVIERIATVLIAASTLREAHYSLVRAWPETGRFHQVRRHLKHLGHPVVGDANYGRSEHNRLCRACFGLSRLALHAARISLPHPRHGGRVHWLASLPEDLAQPLGRMGFSGELLRNIAQLARSLE